MRVLLATLIVQLASAASQCGFSLAVFSDNTCSTVKTNMGTIYDATTGIATVETNIGKCYTSLGANIKIEVCNDQKNWVAYTHYDDANCNTLGSVHGVRGYEQGVCTIYDDSTWVKMTDIQLTGNKYGLGYGEGWTIFLCQTVLFGVCAGY